MFYKIFLAMMHLTLLALVIGAIVMLYPFKPIEITSPYPVSSTKIKAGDTIQYSVHFCKYKNGSVEIFPTLVNDIMLSFTPTKTNFPLGCHTETVAREIPSFAPPGKYKIIFNIEYRFLQIRTITINTETVEFEVVK